MEFSNLLIQCRKIHRENIVQCSKIVKRKKQFDWSQITLMHAQHRNVFDK